MPLTPPPIDDRGYRELLNDALARIPVHTPEWTNFTEGDPGVTLLELFAFMADSVLYRARLIPERNRLKFLSLLGVAPRPPAAASGVVTVFNERGPRTVLSLASGVTVSAGKIPFVTTSALDVLPLEGRVYLRRSLTAPAAVARAASMYAQLYGATLDDPDAALDYYETVPLDAPTSASGLSGVDVAQTTVDGAIWLALLVRPGEEGDRAAIIEQIAGKTLTVGLMPGTAVTSRTLRAAGSEVPTPPPRLRFDLTTGRITGTNAEYLPLEGRVDGDFANDLTLVQLELPGASRIGVPLDLDPLEAGTGDLPPALEDQKVEARLVAWLRIRLPDAAGNDAGASAAWTSTLCWVGINAARISQRVAVAAERVGTGTGEPDQSFRLVSTPVLPAHIALAVAGEPWQRIDDLAAAPSEVSAPADSGWAGAVDPSTVTVSSTDPRVFALDPESGEIRFGDGLRGARPAAGALIVASYAHGGGRVGNVGIGAIKAAPLLPPGFAVLNPLPTWGGDDGESTADAERQVARWLRHRDRAVTAEDFADIARRTPGVSVGRVDVLPLYHPEAGAPSPGVVTVLLVPNDRTRTAPIPDRLFLAAVCAHLEPRRVLTSEVVVVGPTYVGVSLSVGLELVPGAALPIVRDAVAAALKAFLSPLDGGLMGTGWPLDKVVEERELWAQAARVAGVASVRGILMWDSAGARIDRLPLSGLELPELLRVVVGSGDPEEIAEPPVAAPRRVPVPVLPASC